MSIARKALAFSSSALGGALALSLAAPGAASAQTAPAASGGQATIAEVVVTAQKREQRLQDVPISVSVVTGQKIADLHATDLRSIQGYVPNLAILTSGVNPIVYIRGFGSGPNNIGFDQEVSVYSDGVYGGRSAQFTAPFFDVARIEVLRGPQGALFGKNTAAGAISIVSAGPTSRPEASVTAAYDFAQKGYDLEGYASGPITDNLGGRLALKLVNKDGYIKNLASGNDEPHTYEGLARLILRYAPGDNFDVTGKIEYGHVKEVGGINESGPLNARPSFTDERYVSEPYGASPLPEENWITSKNGALTANWRIGGHTLTSVTGYSYYDTQRLSAYDELNPDHSLPPPGFNSRFANDFPEHFHQFSQELRLLSPTGQRLEYLVGLYYDTSRFRLRQDAYYQNVVFGLFTGSQATNFDQHAQTYSAFGQATLHVTDALRAIGSLRYSETDKDATFTSQTTSGVPLNPISSAAGSLKEHYLDPSGTLQYDLRPGVMLYVTYARGSKSGGFVSNTFGTTDSTFQYRPERSTNYEGGIKSTWLEGRLVANLTVFHMEFTNLQQSAFDPNQQTFITRNAARASSQGVETDVQWLPIRSLQLSLSGAYLDAKYDDFPGAQCLATETLAQCNSANPASLAAHNLRGLPLMFSPKWSGNLTARHTLDLPSDLRLVSTVSAIFRSKYYVSEDYSPDYGLQGGWVKWDARIQLGPQDDRWRVALVGRNLFNAKMVGQALEFPAVITGTGRSMSWLDEFRSIMLEVGYRFQ